MTHETRKYFCTRPKLYSILIQAGFRPIEIVPHFINPDYHVWVFEETKELRDIIEDYFAQI